MSREGYGQRSIITDKPIAQDIKSGAVTLLETAQERVKLIKAGLTGKEIERLYIQRKTEA